MTSAILAAITRLDPRDGITDLGKLRQALPGVPRAELDAELVRLALAGTLDLQVCNYPQRVDRAAALLWGGTLRWFVVLRDDTLRAFQRWCQGA